MKLAAGKFYVSRNGLVWCCFKVDPRAEEHTYAHCIRIYDSRIEYFFQDGRYERKGTDEHTLVRRLMINGEAKTPDSDPAKG